MTVNILIVFVLTGLALGAGWLTWRAVSARRRWVKIAGGLGAGLLTLLLAAVAFAGARGAVMLYAPRAPAAASREIPASPALVARGEYLVNISCVGCHSAVDAQGNPSGQLPVSGGWNIAAAEGFGFVGDMVTENLTPGGKLAGYSDGELFRALRNSVTQDGRRLGMMAMLTYGQLSDQDTEAIVAYLRSLPAVESQVVTGDQFNFLGTLMVGLGMFPLAEFSSEPVSAPPEGITAAYGEYVATFGDCRGCHGPSMSGMPASMAGPAVPNPRPLTSQMTAGQFIEMMRTGLRPDGRPFSEAMPWQSASNMTDADLEALYTYLTTPVNE